MNVKTLCLMGSLALFGALSTANASVVAGDPSDPVSVLYSQSSWVEGSATTLTTLDAPGAGEIFLTLTDLSDPIPFQSLQFSLTNSPSALVGMADPGTLTLDLSGATTLYADVVAKTQSPTSYGLYNLTATFVGAASDPAPVPLPASGLMLGAGLMAMLFGLPGGCGRLLLRRLWDRQAQWSDRLVQAAVISA